MTSEVDVANMSLDQIGCRFSLQSLNPPLPAPNAVTVARHFVPKRDALFRAAHWNCARIQSPNLTVLRAAQGTPENPSGALPQPPPPFLYEYELPPDYIAARYLIPNPPQTGGGNPFPAGVMSTPGFPFDGAYPFAIGISTNSQNAQIKVLWTNLQYAQIVYTAQVRNPDLWDPSFLLAFTATLGAWLVNPLNRNSELVKEQIQIAAEVIKQARVSDGNEGPTTSTDVWPDYLLARGFTGLRSFDGSCGWYGWSSMGFPGGVFV